MAKYRVNVDRGYEVPVVGRKVRNYGVIDTEGQAFKDVFAKIEDEKERKSAEDRFQKKLTDDVKAGLLVSDTRSSAPADATRAGGPKAKQTGMSKNTGTMNGPDGERG